MSIAIIGLGLAAVLAVWPIEASFAAAGRQGMRNLAAKYPSLRQAISSIVDLPIAPSAGLTLLRVVALSAGIAAAADLLLTGTDMGWPPFVATCLGFMLFAAAAHFACRRTRRGLRREHNRRNFPLTY